jgi:hypothetical protein
VDADREAYLEQEIKEGCRKGSILRTGGRRVDADKEAYWELEEEHFE